MSLASRLTGIVGIFLLVGLGTSILHSERVATVFAAADRNGAEAHRATRLALQTQVHFKKQVQEWKNILLRGATDKDLGKYTQQFRAETETVRKLTDDMLRMLPPKTDAARAARAFAEAHRKLSTQYTAGFALFMEDRHDPYRVDRKVRGIDRLPTKLLDEVVTGVSAWRDDSLDVGATELMVAQRQALIAQVIAVLVATALTLWALRQWVHQPIRTLTEAAERLADGDLGLSVNIDGGGEVGVLSAAFNDMSRQIAELVGRVRTNANIEHELEIAETVQAALIPEPVVHRRCGLEIVGHYLPASRCGGDWWSFFQLSDHQTLILIGDVTGHGIPTTLITSSVNACCAELYRTTSEMNRICRQDQTQWQAYIEKRGSLSYLLSHLNESISGLGRGRFLMTFSAALIDTSDDSLTYASAGHETPLLLKGGSDASVVPLFSGPTQRLGEQSDQPHVQTRISFSEGDSVLWYTDGLIDAVDPRKRQYGDGRLLRTLKKSHGQCASTLVNHVLDDVRTFADGAESGDDITVVAVQRSPSADNKVAAP